MEWKPTYNPFNTTTNAYVTRILAYKAINGTCRRVFDPHRDGEKSRWAELLRALFFMYTTAFGMYLVILAKPLGHI